MSAGDAMYLHRAVGLTIASNILLTPLIPVNQGAVIPDAFFQITQRKIADILSAPTCEVGAWFRFQGESRLSVVDAAHLNVEYDPEQVGLATVLAFVYGPGLAILLALRGEFPLHLSAVAIGGRALAFSGPSGAGKSTLAASMVFRAGGRLIADDLGLIRICNGVPVITGIAERGLKLFSSSVEGLALEGEVIGREEDQKQKSIISVPSERASHGATLDAICLLEISDTVSEPAIKRMSRPEALIASRQLLFVPAIGIEFWEFKVALDFLGSLVSLLPFYKIVRPRSNGAELADVLSAIENFGILPGSRV